MRRSLQPLEEATGGVRFAGWRPAQFAACDGIVSDPAASRSNSRHRLDPVSSHIAALSAENCERTRRGPWRSHLSPHTGENCERRSGGPDLWGLW